MPRNKLSDLNNHLFATIEALYDGEMDVERARAIAAVADQIIGIKKVECVQAQILLKAGYGDSVAQLLPKGEGQEEE